MTTAPRKVIKTAPALLAPKPRPATARPATTNGNSTNGTSNGTKKPWSETVTLTPAMAEEWLTRNTHNRVIRNGRIEELVGAIVRGEWFLNGDAIRFAIDGSLLDGQHRLWAVVLADIPIETMVVWDLQPESQDTMDTGTRRNLGDVLRLRKEDNAPNLAAALCLQWRWDEGVVRNASRKPSVAQALAVLERNADLRITVGSAVRLAKRFKMSTSVLAVSWYQFRVLDKDDSDEFFLHLFDGIGLEPGSPVLAMRTWLERHMGVGAKAGAIMCHALLIKAWNAYRDGRHVEQLVWRAAGAHAEPFPVPK